MVSCKFNIAEKKRAIFALTNNCNYGCCYCIFGSGRKHSIYTIDLARIKEIITELKANGFEDIKFTGGEPFVREDIQAILKYADSLGLFFDVSTNASLISNSHALELSKLKHLKYVHVSLDGHDQPTHEYVRGKNTFEPTLSGLAQLTGCNVPVRLGCVIHRKNECSLEQMVRKAIALYVKNMVFSMMAAAGRLPASSIKLASSDEDSLYTELQRLKTKYAKHIKIDINLSMSTVYTQPSCPAGTKFIYVNHLGMFSPCTWLSDINPDLWFDSISDAVLSNYATCTQCPASLPAKT